MDGHVFPQQPIKAIEQKQFPPMPVIIGNTAGETWGWADSAGKVTDAASFVAAIDKVFGAAAREQILQLYPLGAFASPRHAFMQLTTDAEFTCTSRRVARALSRAQTKPVYRYLFAQALENDPAQKAQGPVHTIEHSFLFGWQGKYQPTDADRVVQRQVVLYWTRMAKTGNPNGPGNPDWPAASGDGNAYLEIGAVTTAKSSDANAHCDFWDRTPPLWPHV
jgi:para-nitrobenzyl esterase